MNESTNNLTKVLGFVPFLLGLILFYVGSLGYAWAWLIGSLLIFAVIIYYKIGNFSEYLNQIRTDTGEIKSLKLYCFVGILETIIIILICLVLLGLAGYGYFYGKDYKTILDETITKATTGYLLAILGGVGLLTSVHHIWGNFLAKDFRFSELAYSFKMLIIGFFSLILFAVGVFILTLP